MSFRSLVYLVVVVPFVLLSAINVFSLQQVISRYEMMLEAAEEAKIGFVAGEINELVHKLDRTAINLSRPREIRHAVEAADNDVLYDWSSSFINGIDSVIFCGVDGIVLSRAPDEFKFGDEIPHEPFFSTCKEEGVFKGLAMIDGRLCLAVCRLIKKYNDMPVGMVVIAVHITPPMLGRLAPDDYTVLTVAGPQEAVSSSKTVGLIQKQTTILSELDDFAGADRFSLTIIKDTSHEELVRLKRSLARNSLLAGVVTLFFLLMLLRRQFAPYRRVVDGILAYSGERIALPELRKRLVDVRRQPASEVTRISDALVRMIDVIADNIASIERLNNELSEQAARDPLTGLYNRRSLTEALTSEILRAQRYKAGFSVVTADVDYFKSINDKYGHPEGDRILRDVAATFTANSRVTDMVSRWGGEEFLILCPGISLSEALAFAEKLRAGVQDEVKIGGHDVTASFGVAEYRPGETKDDFLARADAALYQAKEDGRNLVRARM